MDLGKIVRNLSFGLLVTATTFSPAYAKETTKQAPKAPTAKQLDMKSPTFVEDATKFATDYLNETYRRPAKLEDFTPDTTMSKSMVNYTDYLVKNGQDLVEKELGLLSNGVRNVFPFSITLKVMHTPDPDFTKDSENLAKLGKYAGFTESRINWGSIEERIRQSIDGLVSLAPAHRSHFWIPSKAGENSLGFVYAEGLTSESKPQPYFIVMILPQQVNSLKTHREMLRSGKIEVPRIVKTPIDDAIVSGRLSGELPNPGDTPQNVYGFCPGVQVFDPEMTGWRVVPEKSFVKYNGFPVKFSAKDAYSDNLFFNHTGPGGFLTPPEAKAGTKVDWMMTLRAKKGKEVVELPFSGTYTTK